LLALASLAASESRRAEGRVSITTRVPGRPRIHSEAWPPKAAAASSRRSNLSARNPLRFRSLWR